MIIIYIVTVCMVLYSPDDKCCNHHSKLFLNNMCLNLLSKYGSRYRQTQIHLNLVWFWNLWLDIHKNYTCILIFHTIWFCDCYTLYFCPYFILHLQCTKQVWEQHIFETAVLQWLMNWGCRKGDLKMTDGCVSWFDSGFTVLHD